jgi:hypothetical protein
MQVRKLVEMSRQANISKLAEPEDFFEGEKVPEYASHKWVEEMERREKEAEKRAVEGVRKEEPVLRITPEEKQREQLLAGEKTGPGDLMSDPRRMTILACLKDGMTFWDEQGTLVARKEVGGVEYRREIGLIDSAVKRLIKLFSISLEGAWSGPFPQKPPSTGAPPAGEKTEEEGKGMAGELKKVIEEYGKEIEDLKKILTEILPRLAPLQGNEKNQLSSEPGEKPHAPPEQSKQRELAKQHMPPRPEKPASPKLPAPPQPKQPEISEPSEDRESKVVRLKQTGARWYINKVSSKQYARAYLGGKYTSLGPLDEELRQLFKKHNIFLR